MEPPPDHTKQQWNVLGGSSHSSVDRRKGILWVKWKAVCRRRKIKITTVVEYGETEKNHQLDDDQLSPLCKGLSHAVLKTFQDIWLSSGQPVFPLIFRLRKLTLSWTHPPGCPFGHLIVNIPKSELTPCSLIPAPSCQAAGHARVIPNNKDSCPCVCGAITWATSRVSPRPLGNKCVSPSLPRREGTWEWHMWRLCSPNNLLRWSGRGSRVRTPPTHWNLPAGPLGSLPPTKLSFLFTPSSFSSGSSSLQMPVTFPNANITRHYPWPLPMVSQINQLLSMKPMWGQSPVRI